MDEVDVEPGHFPVGQFFQRQRVDHPLDVFHAVGVLVEVDVAVPYAVRVPERSSDAGDTGRPVDGTGDRDQRFRVADVVAQVERLPRPHVDHGPVGGGGGDAPALRVFDDEVAGRHQAVDLPHPRADRVGFVFVGKAFHLDGHPRQDPCRVGALHPADAETDAVGVLSGRVQNVVAQGDDRGFFGQVHLARLDAVVVSGINGVFHSVRRLLSADQMRSMAVESTVSTTIIFR